MGSVLSFLTTNKKFNEIYSSSEHIMINLVASNVMYQLYEKLYASMKNVKLIITHHIHDGYRNNNIFQTSTLLDYLSKHNSNCKVIILENAYLEFYFPFLTVKPSLPFYHDALIYDEFLKGKSYEEQKDIFLSNFNNENLMNKESIKNLLNKSIDELIKRKRNQEQLKTLNNSLQIEVAENIDFIIQECKNKLLMYSMNHPSKYYFHNIVDKILSLLGIEPEVYPSDLDPLLFYTAPIYKTLNSLLNFDPSSYNNQLHLNDTIAGIENYFDYYYFTYLSKNK